MAGTQKRKLHIKSMSAASSIRRRSGQEKKAAKLSEKMAEALKTHNLKDVEKYYDEYLDVYYPSNPPTISEEAKNAKIALDAANSAKFIAKLEEQQKLEEERVKRLSDKERAAEEREEEARRKWDEIHDLNKFNHTN